MNELLGLGCEQVPVMLVTRNLPPLRGGMERLNMHIAEELAANFHVQVIGPDGCRNQLPAAIDVQEVAVRPLWRFLLQVLHHSLQLAWKMKPRVVLAGSGLTAPFAVLAARLAGGRSAVYAHGLDLLVQHRLYRALWMPFLRRCDLCIVNSRNTARLAMQIGIRSERIAIIHPGVSLPVEQGDQNGTDFRRRYGLVTSKLLLSVGRLTPRKGLLEFVRHALPQIVDVCPSVVLIVIGDEAPDALLGAGTGGAAKILKCARELGIERHILMLGACNDIELSAAYDAVNLCIFPVLDIPGDVEGFGMVAIEAAAHGLPTVAFDVGGVADAIADGRSGWLVPAGDYVRIAEQILRKLDARSAPEVRAECRGFAEAFEWHRFGSRLRGQLQQLISGDKS